MRKESGRTKVAPKRRMNSVFLPKCEMPSREKAFCVFGVFIVDSFILIEVYLYCGMTWIEYADEAN